METVEPLGSVGVSPSFMSAPDRYGQFSSKVGWVAEIQGLYGPVSVSETVVQKIWLRQDFLTDDLTTSSGETLRVHSPGRWNLQEGPDFKEAVLEIGGKQMVGDVEVHFYPEDWRHHGHDKDGNYDRVVLHVLLFGGNPGEEQIQTHSGKRFAEFCLLEYLHHDIEAYAADEALRALAQPDESALIEWMLSRSIQDRWDALCERAHYRWRQKCRFARQRLNQYGWEEACHQFALEVLGYSRNRAPMASIALAHPLASMRIRLPNAIELYEQQRQRWKLAGLRPANHPKRRLQQYLNWVEVAADWPKVLRDGLGGELVNVNPVSESDTTTFRKAVKLPELRRYVQEDIIGGNIVATRLDTLMVDAFLPLYAEFSGERLFGYWFHWYVGDMPTGLNAFLKTCDVCGAGRVLCNGLYQGALQCFHEM